LVLLAGESCKKYLFRSNKKNKKNDLKKHAHIQEDKSSNHPHLILFV